MARIRTTRSGRDSAGNRAVLRHSSASSRGSRRRRRRDPHRRSTRCYSRVVRRHTATLIVTTSRRRATGPGLVGLRRGPCLPTTLKLIPIGIQRHREASAGLRTARAPRGAPSSPRPVTGLQGPILSGIHRLLVLREHPTPGRRSPRIRATREAVHHSLLRSRRARRAPERHRARPAGCPRRKTRSTRRTTRPTGRSHLLSTRVIHHRRGHLSRPHQTHTILIRI